MNAATTEDIVQVEQRDGQEWLYYPAIRPDVAIIRGTTADEAGNITFEDEGSTLGALDQAYAAHNNGGIVIAQVKRLARRGSLPARDVKVPAALIDYVYVDPDQTQTYMTPYSPYYAGALRRPSMAPPAPPLDVRKIIARRSLLEFQAGDICNLGFGISQGIGAIAFEEGIADRLVLTVEQGIFGGVPVAGNEGGAGFNYQAMIEQPSMFDFYDGGGLDVASLSFAEVDRHGNVNVHAFEGRLRGPGGFPNISARTKKICFVGTLTARGLDVAAEDGRLQIRAEGALPKFVEEVREVSFSGRMARENGQEVRFITERAVFALREDGVTLIEVAEGIDVRRDVLDRMAFAPIVPDDVGTIDPRVYAAGPMGLADTLTARAAAPHPAPEGAPA
jgi:propionate CoA-transferase